MEESWRGRPGRKPLHPTDPSVRMTLTLRQSSYTALERRASGRGLTVPEYLRRSIDAAEQLRLRKPDKN